MDERKLVAYGDWFEGDMRESEMGLKYWLFKLISSLGVNKWRSTFK